MKLTPRPDQEQKIQRVLAEPTQGALIADDMGKGKTLMGTEIILRQRLNRVLIVGIRDTFKQWTETFNGQSDGRVQLRVMNSKVAGEKNYDAFMNGEPGIYFAGIQWLTSRDWETITTLDHNGNPIPVIKKKTGMPTGKNVTQRVHLQHFGRKLNTKKRHVDMVMFDEVHKMQNRHSDTARTILSIKSDWRIGLSGTFAGNSFEGAWKSCYWIWPTIIDRSFIRWKRVWCEVKEITRTDGSVLTGFRGEPKEKITGEKVEGAFVATLPCYIRDEPEKVPAPRLLHVQLTPRQRTQYTSMEGASLAWVEAHTPSGHDVTIADIPITQRQRLRTMTLGEVRLGHNDEVTFDIDTPSAKLNVLKYIVDEIWKDQPILIGCYSKEFAKIAAARFKRAGYGAEAWHGDLSPTRRTGEGGLKDRFIARDPTVRYLFATIPSIGTGTDGLQKACSKIVWLEESESQIDNEQFVKRCFRDGMTLDFGPFEHVKIVADDTLDLGILNKHDAQARSMRASLRAA